VEVDGAQTAGHAETDDFRGEPAGDEHQEGEGEARQERADLHEHRANRLDEHVKVFHRDPPVAGARRQDADERDATQSGRFASS
jgi:hypothetical protein